MTLSHSECVFPVSLRGVTMLFFLFILFLAVSAHRLPKTCPPHRLATCLHATSGSSCTASYSTELSTSTVTTKTRCEWVVPIPNNASCSIITTKHYCHNFVQTNATTHQQYCCQWKQDPVTAAASCVVSDALCPVGAKIGLCVPNGGACTP